MLVKAMGAQARYLALGRIESVSVTQDRTIHDPDYNLAVSRPPLDSRDRQRHSTIVDILRFASSPIHARPDLFRQSPPFGKLVWMKAMTAPTSANSCTAGSRGMAGAIREVSRPRTR